MPIPVRDDAWGAIWVMSQRPEVRFDAEDLRLLTSLADFTGATMHVARMKALAESRAIQAETAQSALREAQIDAWLFYDHHHRDPLAYNILGLDPGMHVTRRWFYLIPAEGEPKKLVHRIESGRLDAEKTLGRHQRNQRASGLGLFSLRL